MNAVPDLELVQEPQRAQALLHPLRIEILRRAVEPRSASEIAGLLELPRQRVNYHVRALHAAGLLQRAGSRRRRNLLERRYQATARAYALDPDVLGPLAVRRREIEDTLSAAYLIALCEETRRDLGRASREAQAEGKRLSTLSISAELRFEDPRQREAFAEALRDAVLRVVADHASPAVREDGTPGAGRPYRLLVGCHPVPPGRDASSHPPASTEGDNP